MLKTHTSASFPTQEIIYRILGFGNSPELSMEFKYCIVHSANQIRFTKDYVLTSQSYVPCYVRDAGRDTTFHAN